jgi:hypothetical protein
MNTVEWIAKAILVHGIRYDYSLVDYRGADKKVEIVCHEHKSFWQNPYNHLAKNGCPKCAHIHRAPKQI